MGVPEILQRLTELARADLSNFMVRVTPEMAQAAIDACGSDEERAKYTLGPRGWRSFPAGSASSRPGKD